jgi:HlyD family secretion protein
MKWWKVLIAVVLLLGAAGITMAGMKDRQTPATEVQISRAKKGTITRLVVGAGKVQPATTVKISCNLSGDLIDRPVNAGDHVKKGQLLGKIDQRPYVAALRREQAAVSGAKADVQASQVDLTQNDSELARVQSLVTKGLASTAELDKARATRDSSAAKLASAQQRLSQADATFQEAQTNLERTTLYAPIDGTVIETNHEVGERVRGSDFSEDTVMSLGTTASMEVQIDVGEHEVVWLKQGQKADISVDAIEGETFSGQVVEIAQQATIKNPGTEQEVTSFPVKVALDSLPTNVLPGMSAEVRIAAQTHKDAILVPIQAVSVRSEKSLPDAKMVEENSKLQARPGDQLAKVVFVVDGENKARVRRVKTGIAADTDLEITDGLKEGDRVIEGPYRVVSRELQDGTVVRESQGPGGPGGPGAMTKG